MEEKKKKRYTKPKIKKIRLDARCAVLGFCKSNNHIGPVSFDCGIPDSPCDSSGS
jgi:nitroimidazol reductase NimA-like FMN-containing flavoprotein (pyridoxamine 5'-phosphate oxidase superfamily)